LRRLPGDLVTFCIHVRIPVGDRLVCCRPAGLLGQSSRPDGSRSSVPLIEAFGPVAVSLVACWSNRCPVASSPPCWFQTSCRRDHDGTIRLGDLAACMVEVVRRLAR
jgi:hypothetical protein